MENKVGPLTALKQVYNTLNSPLKGGRLYVTYDKEVIKSVLKVLYESINSLPNSKTLSVMADTDNGLNLKSYSSAEELFKDLKI